MSVTRRVVRGTTEAILAVLLGDRHGHGDQHGVHRAAECDVPRCDDPAGASRPGDRPHGGGADGRDVPGGVCATTSVGSTTVCGGRSPERGGRKWQRADTGDGRGADRSSVDDARVVEPSGASAALGRAEASWTSSQAKRALGKSRGSVTTVKCGATPLRAPDARQCYNPGGARLPMGRSYFSEMLRFPSRKIRFRGYCPRGGRP